MYKEGVFSNLIYNCQLAEDVFSKKALIGVSKQ